MNPADSITPTQPKPPKSNAAPPIWRRLFHLTFGSIVPVVGIFASAPLMLLVTGFLALAAIALDLARFRSTTLNKVFLGLLAPLLKINEDYRITGATYMMIAAFFAFLLYDQTVAVTALLFLSIGDPVAALVGRRMTGPRVFGKSPLGTVAFIAVSSLVIAALVSGGVVQFHWGLAAGAVVAGVVEITPLPVDDNLTIPLISGAVMHFLMF